VIRAAELAALLGLPEPTPEQAAVIESGLEPAVVIAGAGSGKTETMAARVLWLVANRKVAPDAVLGLTFTRKAAAELGQRIRRRLAQWRQVLERDQPDEQEQLAQLRAGEPTVLTYAAYAGRLVSEQALRLGAEPDARLLSPAAAWQLAAAAVRQHRGTLPAEIGVPSSLVNYVLAMAGQFADHLVGPDDVQRYCDEVLTWFETLPPGERTRSSRPGRTKEFCAAIEHRTALLPLVEAFAAAKAAVPAVDFGDQMRLAAQLAQLDEVRESERTRYRAVLLDEYQDTGHAQVAMLHGLYGAGHAVTAVGDPFQSIYGWRGASAGNIGAFAQTFPRTGGAPAQVYPLVTSFRNDRAILHLANAVAAVLRSGPTTIALAPRSGAGAGHVALARTETVEDEAAWVARELRSAWENRAAGARTAAVLVRRRAQIPLLAEAVQQVGLPVEVVGLGGLLTVPEVADVVAPLRVLAEHGPGSALMRLLTGARWRIGPRDLAALHTRAQRLVRPAAPVPAERDDEEERASLVEALDDLGAPDRYSAEGYRRLSALSAELRQLRRRSGAALTELVADVERTIGVDIEVAARPDRAVVGRAHLDRFVDEATRFAAEASDARGATLSAFLAYLDAAEQEENGLEMGEAVVVAERVQILTVHAAKGLEWDIVAIPGLVEGVFPAPAQSVNWTKTRHELPAPLRGDADDLPALDLAGAADRREVSDRLAAHHDAVLARHAEEERRLAYVAMTRARTSLLLSGYCWDGTLSAREPSPYLREAAEHCAPAEWFDPPDGAQNPLLAVQRTARWPADPLGPRPGEPGAGRRPAVATGAELVRAAAAGAGGPAQPVAGRARQWRADVDVLLAERDQLRRGTTIDVPLPARLSVSQLVDLQRDPQALARRIRRPMPAAPAPLARRGTAFHAWLEQRWQAQALLDVDELPGAADDGADDADFLVLREAFERSEWVDRTPAEVEVPFEMVIAGTVIRGRMDAVFGSDADGWLIVDWKTGAQPSGAAARAAAVQLAGYRLAWARLRHIPDDQLHRVGAAFHYVRSGVTVAPADLLDAAGLQALVAGR
jgi:DNA helicase-2/ATP-dependent DNA helicase PcrA